MSWSSTEAVPVPAPPVLEGISRWPVVAVFAFVATAYAAGSEVALTWFGALGIGLPVFFPAAGLTLGALIVVGRRRWLVVLAAAGVAEFVGDVAHGLGPAAALGFAVANTMEPLAGAVLLQSNNGRVDVGRRAGLARFLAGPALLAPLIGAVIGATSQALFLDPTGWLDAAWRWWVGDSLGVLVVGGVILACLSDTAVETTRHRVVEVAGLLAATCAVVAVALWAQVFALLYGVVLLLVWAAFRVGVLSIARGRDVRRRPRRAGDRHPGQPPAGARVQPQRLSLLHVQLLIIVVIATMMAFAVEVGKREQTLRRFTAAAAAAAAERAALPPERPAVRPSPTALGHATTIDDTIAAHCTSTVWSPAGAVRLVGGGGVGRRRGSGRSPAGSRARLPSGSRPCRATRRCPGRPRSATAGCASSPPWHQTRRLFPAAVDVLDGTDFTAAAVLPLRRAGTTIGYIGCPLRGRARVHPRGPPAVRGDGRPGRPHPRTRPALRDGRRAAEARRTPGPARAAAQRHHHPARRCLRRAGAAPGPRRRAGAGDRRFRRGRDTDPGRRTPRLVALSHADPAQVDDLRRLRERHALLVDEPNAVARHPRDRGDPARRTDRSGHDREVHTLDPEARSLLTSLAPCSCAAVPARPSPARCMGAVLLGYAASGRHYEARRRGVPAEHGGQGGARGRERTAPPRRRGGSPRPSSAACCPRRYRCWPGSTSRCATCPRPRARGPAGTGTTSWTSTPARSPSSSVTSSGTGLLPPPSWDSCAAR